MRAQQRLERRSRRRLAKHLVARNAQWRRFVARAMAAGMAAVLAGQMMVSEAAAAPRPYAPSPASSQA
jgi:hypothetical protein